MVKLCAYCKTNPIGPRSALFCSAVCRGASQQATPEQRLAKKERKRIQSQKYMQDKRQDTDFAEKERESRRLYMQKWAQENPEIKKQRNLAYKQKYRDKINATQRIRGASYREKHRQELNQKALQYHKEHPEVGTQARARRRVRILNTTKNDFNQQQWKEVKASFNNCCAYCDKYSQRLEMDHLTPIIKGGLHTLHNIVPACRTCNRRKHTGNVLKQIQPLLLTCAVSGFRKYTRK